MKYIPCVRPKAWLFSRSTDGSKKMLLRPGQKGMKRIMDLLSKSYQAIELVLDTCLRFLATTKERFQLPGHRLFAGCEIDPAGFQDGLPSLVALYACQILSPDSGMTAASRWLRRAMCSGRRGEPCRHKGGLIAGLYRLD